MLIGFKIKCSQVTRYKAANHCVKSSFVVKSERERERLYLSYEEEIKDARLSPLRGAQKQKQNILSLIFSRTCEFLFKRFLHLNGVDFLWFIFVQSEGGNARLPTHVADNLINTLLTIVN